MMAKQLIGALLLICVWFVVTVGGRIEGYFFPVSAIGQIEAHEPVGETWTRVWGEAIRFRQCSFDHLSWYLVRVGEDARADLIFEEGTKMDGGGHFDFGPWLVQLPASQLFERSYAIAYHRCHPFWLTATRFYG